MRKALWAVCLVAMLFTLANCQEEESSVSTETDGRAAVVGESLIDIPSALSDSGTSTAAPRLYASSFEVNQSTAPSTEDQPVWELFEGIRQNIGAIEEWSSLIKELTADIYSIIGRSDSGDWINNSPASGDPSRIVWGPDSSNVYDHKMELYFEGIKGFEAYLTVNEGDRSAKGTYTWDFSKIADNDPSNDNSQVQFHFDSTVSPKYMEIKITGMSGDANKGWIKVTQSSDHIVTLWGNYYFPSLDMFTDNTSDAKQDRNYVFAAAGYDETGQNATNKNKAVLQLILPPSDVSSDSNMWNTYSTGAIFVDQIKQMWQNMGLTTAQLEAWVPGLFLSYTSGVITNIAYDDVITILNHARDNAGGDATADDMANLIFVTKMVNPVYFDAYGFLGTCLDDPTGDSSCEQGTMTSPPTGYDALAVGSVSADVPDPYDVKTLSVDFL